jgi:hypothetical protein
VPLSGALPSDALPSNVLRSEPPLSALAAGPSSGVTATSAFEVTLVSALEVALASALVLTPASALEVTLASVVNSRLSTPASVSHAHTVNATTSARTLPGKTVDPECFQNPDISNTPPR